MVSPPRKPPRRGNSFSGNGAWWWSGQAWSPAVSPDRRWRFNGLAWTPAAQRAWAPRGVPVFGAGWIVLLAGWLIVAAVQLVADYPASPSSTQTGVVAGLAGLALAATAGWGFILGRHRLWAWIWISVPVGTVVEMVFYEMAMLAVPGPNGESQDTAASVWLVILTVPTALLLLGLLWLGAGASRLRVGSGISEARSDHVPN